MDREFWDGIDRLVEGADIIIEHPKGSEDPRKVDYVYELDYGYVEKNLYGEKEGIDLWLGSDADLIVNAVVCTVDLEKGGSEIKLLMACTEEEKQLVINNLNNSNDLKAILINRQVY